MARRVLAKMLLGGTATAVVLCLVAAVANAAVQPGDVVSPESAESVKTLVSPGIYYAVTHGMRMKSSRPEQIDWPPPYKEATEKYPARSGSRKIIAASSDTLRASRFR